MFSLLWKSLSPRKTRRPRRHRWLPPRLEPLEDRTLLATTVFSSTDVPLNIASGTTAVSKLAINDSGLLQHLSVTLDIDCPLEDVINTFLVAPDGTRVNLFANLSGGSSNFRQTTLDDNAPTSIQEATAPYTGTFRSDEPLAGLNGRPLHGVWELGIVNNAFADDATLNSWSLTTDTVQPGLVRGTVWEDPDGDGIRQAGDPGLANVTVYADLNGNGKQDPGEPSTVTDRNGDYVLANVPPGLQTVSEVTPVNFLSGHSQAVNVVSGETVSGVDFANRPVADLVGLTFDVAQRSALWGDTVTASYTVLNQGRADAGPFKVNLNLSANPAISAAAWAGGAGPVLASVNVAGLAAGASTSGTFSVTLPGDPNHPPAAFVGADHAFLGLVIDPENAVIEGDKTNNAGRDRPLNVDRLAILTPVTESAGNKSPQSADALTLPAIVGGSIDPSGDQDFYTFSLAGSGRLTARVSAAPPGANATGLASLAPRLTLFTADGRELVQSDGLAGNDNVALVDQHLTPGTYLLRVSAQVEQGQGSAGAYRLQADFTTALPPLEPLSPQTSSDFLPQSVVAADVNGDGRIDLVADNREEVTVLLGNGDGSFGPPQQVEKGATHNQVLVLDLNNDRRPDIIIENPFTPGKSLMVLLNQGDGTFEPAKFFDAGDGITQLLAADVNNDGRVDLITWGPNSRDAFVLLGNGNGTFQEPRRFDLGIAPRSVVVADLNGDGRPDVIANSANGLFVVLGNGDGSFQAPFQVDAGSAASPVALAPGAVTVVDVNHDNKPDLIVSNETFLSSGSAVVLLGNGDGTFQPARPVGANSFGQVVVADVNNDGKPDLLITNTSISGDGSVFVFLGNGDGTFQEARRVDAGSTFGTQLTVADLNNDGFPDVVLNTATELSVLLGNGDGTFRSQRFAVGTNPAPVLVADFNGDGNPDLGTLSRGDRTVSVLLGNGDGSFQERNHFDPGGSPGDLQLVDVNNDGRPDVLTTVGSAFNGSDRQGSLLLGNGDGSFQPFRRFAPGSRSLLSADINGDGRLDFVGLDRTGVTVFLGTGDGSFKAQPLIPFPNFFADLAIADVNGDGKPDLLLSNFDSVAVLLGNGDGTFQAPRRSLAGPPSGTVSRFVTTTATDVNGDGRLDLVVVVGSAVSVLLDNGDGFFQAPRLVEAGDIPADVLVADVNGDGKPDLLFRTNDSKDVSVLLGNGDGTFGIPRRFELGNSPGPLALADVNNDGKPDLLTTNKGFVSGVSVLLGNGNGTFQAPRSFEDDNGNGGPVVIADLNNDGHPDLVTLDRGGVAVWLNNGNGSFQAPRLFAAGRDPKNVRVADLNGDGRLDLLVGDRQGEDVLVLLGKGDGSFVPFTPESATPSRQTPWRADLTRDGTPDLVVLNDAGDILFRRGLPGTDNGYAPPVVVNRGHPASDIIVLHTAAGPVLAATDPRNNTVVVYTWSGTTLVPGPVVPVGLLPQRLAAADLNGDGLDDLVVASELGASVTIAFQKPDGSFAAARTQDVGIAPSDITFAALDGHGLDVLVSSRSSGDVSVLFNDPAHRFARTARYRADTGVAGLQDVSGASNTHARAEPVSIVAGRFTATPGANATGLAGTPGANATGLAGTPGAPDLVVVDRGAHHFETLLGTPGGFANPQASLRFSTSDGLMVNDRPGQVVAGDFDGDGTLDVAILMEDRGEVWLYKGLGDGRFTLLTRVPAGNAPTGLAAADVNGDGKLDLMVGNGFGDVLFILGNGDGTFRPFVRADQRVPFVATDLNGDGVLDVVLADQARDLASARLRIPGTRSFTPGAFQRDGTNGLIGPGAVALADLDGKNGSDLIFANSGSNNILVYLRQPDGSFADTPLSFFVGTNPVALYVADLNGDGLPDLAVANQGSNDVSILFGGHDVAGHWTFKLGPRLRTGGAGPNAVSARDLNGDGIPDLLVTNGQDGTLAVLPGIGTGGVGTGFFDDTNITLMPIVAGPIRQTQVVDATLGFALSQQGTLFRFNPTAGGAAVAFTPAAGREVNAFEAVSPAGSRFPLLFTADRDGSASMLASPDGQTFTEQASVSDASLGNPSALEVLQDGNGQFDIYLTDAGDARPVVLVIGLRAELVAVEGPLALVATLVTDLAPEAAAGPPAASGTVETFNSLVVAPSSALNLAAVFRRAAETNDEDVIVAAGAEVFVSLPGLPAGGGGDVAVVDEGSPLPREETPTLQQFITGLKESLDELGWDQPKEVGPGHDEPEGPAPLDDPATEGASGLAWPSVPGSAGASLSRASSSPTREGTEALPLGRSRIRQNAGYAARILANAATSNGETVFQTVPASCPDGWESRPALPGPGRGADVLFCLDRDVGVSTLTPLLTSAVFASGLYGVLPPREQRSAVSRRPLFADR